MIERVQLAQLPTPIETLPHLTNLLGGPQLFIKRDDLTGLGFGGNKTRKLEYLAADAQAKGCQTLISTGAVQSNHCRQVAAAAARLGMDCILVLAGEKPKEPQGNLYLDLLSGAEVTFVPKDQRDQALAEITRKAEAENRKPYLIPYGGSNAIGALGYRHAMRELDGQGLNPDWIVFATSSGGTQAGMLLGARETGSQAKILGISVDKPAREFSETIAEIANAGAELLQLETRFHPEEILVNDSYCSAGYGMMTPAEKEAILLFARHEAILLDPVYTGRAAAGMLDLIRQGFFKPGEKVLFWHTGGTPALFAEPYRGELAKL
jgi:D-cysteine desulfhydrase family pyridoxal phosphate-dependent enzyme